MPEKISTNGSADPVRSGRISLASGWKGSVNLTCRNGDVISPGQWQKGLCGLEKLLSNPKKQLKADGHTTVAVHDLEIGGKTLRVAVKTHIYRHKLVNLLRGLFRDKSLRSFRTAARLCSNGIPTAYPLAAITQKRGLLPVKTIFITEYIENSIEMHTFLSKNVSQNDAGDKPSGRIKKQFASQIANILARLHNAGLWHRDAKAGNFLVAPAETGGFEIMLIDMDGIKPYLLATDKRRYLAFTKLGSVLIWHKGINLTDYLRSFRIYCNLCKVDKRESGKIFKRLCRSAVALRLLTFAGSAMKK